MDIDNNDLGTLTLERDALRDQLEAMRHRKDGAYEERNKVVALLVRILLDMGWTVGIARTDIEGWDEEWHGCVYAQSPAKGHNVEPFQWSWHYHDSQHHLFAGLPAWTGAYDGHTTEDKYDEIVDLCKTYDATRGS